jgi:hypothetical protein
MAEYLQVNPDGTCTTVHEDHYKDGRIFIKIESNGSRSEGPYWEGRRNGNFYITTSSGNIIEATFINGVFSLRSPCGDYYVGVFDYGFMNSRIKCSKETYDLFSSKFNII